MRWTPGKLPCVDKSEIENRLLQECRLEHPEEGWLAMDRRTKYVAAVCQFAPSYCDPKASLDRMCYRVEEAMSWEKDVRLVVFPETATVGLPRLPESHDEHWKLEPYLEKAENVHGSTSTALGKMAKAHGVYIATGFVEADPVLRGVIYNSSLLIGPDGEIVATHRKVQSGGVFKSGSAVEVHDTAIGKIGLSICYDLWFPEFLRIQVRQGCEVHINMTANQPIFAIGSTHVPIVRAAENEIFVVSANLIGDHRPQGGRQYMGASSVISPFGEVIAIAGQEHEETILGEIDLHRILKTRALFSTIKDIRTDIYEVKYYGPSEGTAGPAS